MIVVPLFLRFDKVKLEYSTGSQSIAQKCESFRGYLASIKSTLYDSNITYFDFQIDEEDQSQFRNHPTFIEHIRHIMSICDLSRGYAFIFSLRTNTYAFDYLIASIIEMPETMHSSFVSIVGGLYDHTNTQLLAETISNWRERHAMNQNQRERCLILYVLDHSIIQGMCDYLEQVSFSRLNI